MLIFASSHFINSFNELKDHLNFNFNFYEENSSKKTNNYTAYIVEDEVLNNKLSLLFKKNKDIPKLIITRHDKNFDIYFDAKIGKPLKIYDLNKKVIDVIKKKEFKKNSFIKVKDYILNKNEKKLKKNNNFILLTEKEIQLIELLFSKKKPIKKTSILKDVWKYSNSADTHTVETHIYRLRKKILNKFNDNNFIVNSKSGYCL